MALLISLIVVLAVAGMAAIAVLMMSSRRSSRRPSRFRSGPLRGPGRDWCGWGNQQKQA